MLFMGCLCLCPASLVRSIISNEDHREIFCKGRQAILWLQLRRHSTHHSQRCFSPLSPVRESYNEYIYILLFAAFGNFQCNFFGKVISLCLFFYLIYQEQHTWLGANPMLSVPTKHAMKLYTSAPQTVYFEKLFCHTLTPLVPINVCRRSKFCMP